MKSKNKRVNYSGWTDQTLNDPSVDSILDKFIRKPQPEKDDHKNDQVDPNPSDHDQDQPDPSTGRTRSQEEPVHRVPVLDENPFVLNTGKFDIVTPDRIEAIGYTKLINTVTDMLPELINPYDLVIYLRLYRLSYGFNKPRCIVGMKGLTKSTGVSETRIHRSLAKLEQLGLIRIIAIHNTGIKGTEYEVLAPVRKEPVLIENPSATKTRSQDALIKHDIDHDDLNRTDHHQAETMMIYKNLTGNNSWTKSDQVAYAKIKHLPLQEISNLIKSTLEKAHQKPASLAYFVKAYQNPIQANPSNKQAVKAKLAAIVQRKQEAHVGARYTIADLAYDVKAECVREGIAFDNDLFNEILEKR